MKSQIFYFWDVELLAEVRNVCLKYHKLFTLMKFTFKFAGCTVYHNAHVYFSSNESLPFTVQRETTFNTKNRIVGHMVLVVLWYSLLWVAIPGHVEQHRNTHFQCGRACLSDGNSHIVDMSMYTDVIYIWHPYGIASLL